MSNFVALSIVCVCLNQTKPYECIGCNINAQVPFGSQSFSGMILDIAFIFAGGWGFAVMHYICLNLFIIA